MDSVHTPRSAPGQPAGSTRQMLDELDALMERMLSLPVADTESAETEVPAPTNPPVAARPASYPTVSAKLTVIESPVGNFGPHSPEPESRQERLTFPFPGMLELPPIESAPADERAAPSWFDLPEEENETPSSQDSPATDESSSVPETSERADALAAQPLVSEMPPIEPEIPAEETWLEKPSGLDWEPTSSASYAEPDSVIAAPLMPIIAPPPSLCIETPKAPKPKLSRVVQSKLGYRPLLRINRGFDNVMGWLGPLGRSMRGKQGRNLLGITGLGLMLGALLWLLKDWMGWNW
ncbi:MAG: hypothetical protein K2X38_06175 [Gemmataceae bacterium]|nr:hypothetical protein [Gemmataceae bacterium]